MSRLIIFILLFSNVCFSQDKFNVVCRDFTFEQDISSKGKFIRNIFEASLSKNEFPFHVLERDKMDKIFETLQEEKNLVKDLSNEWKNKLLLANVDYLVVGDLSENIAKDNFDLVVTFIKITGEDITQKLPLLLTFSKKEISDKEQIRNIITNGLKSFVDDYFILNDDRLGIISTPKIYEELKKRDSLIDSLKAAIRHMNEREVIKERQINRLKSDVSDIKSFTYFSRLDIYGLEKHYAPPLIGGGTELSGLMSKVLETKGNLVYVLMTDSALSYANQVIQKYPKFPFWTLREG